MSREQEYSRLQLSEALADGRTVVVINEDWTRMRADLTSQERAALHGYDEFVAWFGDEARQLAKSWNRSVQWCKRELQVGEEHCAAEGQQKEATQCELERAKQAELFAELEATLVANRRAHRAAHPEQPRCYVCNRPGLKNSPKCPDRELRRVFMQRS